MTQVLNVFKELLLVLRLKGTQRSPNPGGSKIGMIKEEALNPGELHPCRHRDIQGKPKGMRISTSQVQVCGSTSTKFTQMHFEKCLCPEAPWNSPHTF